MANRSSALKHFSQAFLLEAQTAAKLVDMIIGEKVQTTSCS